MNREKAKLMVEEYLAQSDGFDVNEYTPTYSLSRKILRFLFGRILEYFFHKEINPNWYDRKFIRTDKFIIKSITEYKNGYLFYWNTETYVLTGKGPRVNADSTYLFVKKDGTDLYIVDIFFLDSIDHDKNTKEQVISDEYLH